MNTKTPNHAGPAASAAPLGARLAFGLLLAGLSPAFAETRAPAAPATATTTSTSSTTAADSRATTTGELPRGDRRFLVKAAKLGEREVELSRAAGKHAVDARVRSFAEEMVREHTRMNEEIAKLASRKGVTLETRDETERRAAEKKWAEKKAGDFDKDYLDEIIDAHEDTVDVLENGLESKDADIAALSGHALPAVKAHLARAESLEKSLK